MLSVYARVYHPYFGALDCIWGCTNKCFRCKQDIKAILRSLDWVQALNKVLHPQYEGRIHVFPAGTRMQYRMDAADILFMIINSSSP